MKQWALLVGALALAACDDVTGIDRCENPIDFTDEISATGLIALVVDADPGHLQVRGRSGINSVRVFATACADRRSTRDEIDFDLFRVDEVARMISTVPLRDDAHLDLYVEVPLDFDVDVFHSIGDLDIENVFSVIVNDGSGHIDISDIETDVIIDEDGSGDIDVRNVGGDFIVRIDRSGRIRYSNVLGQVVLP